MIRAFRDPADRVVNGAAILVSALALVVLVGGWLLDIEPLRTLAPTWSAMAPLTAILLILISVAIVWFERRPALANVVIAGTALLSLTTLAEYFFDLRVMQAVTAIFVRSDNTLLELPAPDSAAAFLIMTMALSCYRTGRARLHDFADVVVVLIGFVCLQVLMAYAYNLVATSSWRGFRQIAPHSTLSAMLLAFAATARRPSMGLYSALRGDTQSALQLRRLLPATLVSFVILGWLYVIGVRENVAAMPDLVAWTVVGGAVVLAVLLFITSADMRQAEATVRRRQEELVEAKRAAEEASEAKSRFMAVMSHELRTPLTAVIGYANLLDEGLAGEQSAEAKGYADRIRASGWHLVGLIDAVLLYASGKAPAGEMRDQRVDVGELIAATAQTFEHEATRKGLELRVVVPEPAWVITDLRKLRQIITNLLSNALKFTDRGGVDLRAYTRGGKVMIVVSDTGIGISPSHMPHIWEPFRQADASHTRTRGGMGLGLALTQQLADQIGAQLSVQSILGSGSTFSIELPQAEADDVRAISLNGARVLVVDDEAGVRRIMARTLTRYGGEVTQAQSGAEALERIKQGEFDVLVTDISMPEMTGIQLVRRVKALHVPSPVLFVTGAELDDEDLAHIAELNGKLLRKPFDMAELAKTVQLLAGR
ncbi:MAG TPA: ATP-binding protein [Longimicrobiales bacterium]